MRRLAEVGRGNYYFVEDTVALSALFGHELGTLHQTVASDVRLVVTAQPGVTIEEAYGYPMTRNGDSVVVPVADLRAGESRKVVLRVTITAAPRGELAIAQVDVGWRRVSDGVQGAARALAAADVVDDPAAVAASVDPAAMQAVEKALSARALEEAAAAYDRGGVPAAQQILERRVQAVRANAAYLGTGIVEQLETTSATTLDGLATAPAQAKKAASVTAHELAR